MFAAGFTVRKISTLTTPIDISLGEETEAESQEFQRYVDSLTARATSGLSEREAKGGAIRAKNAIAKRKRQKGASHAYSRM